MNQVFYEDQISNSSKRFPKDNMSGRLTVFDKDNKNTTNLERTRPITVNSIILKIYE